MQATARRLSVVSATSCARRRLIRDVRPRNRVKIPIDVNYPTSIAIALLLGGIFVFAGDEAPKYPGNGNCDKFDSPKKTFTIESYGLRPDHNWIVGDLAGKLETVPLPPPSGTGPFCGYEFSISPDEEWIFMDQKLYSGASACWLYRRVKPLHYELIAPCFSRLAIDFYAKSVGQSFEPDDDYFMVRLQGWPKSGDMVRFTLLDHRHDRWEFDFDLKNRVFKRVDANSDNSKQK